MCGIIGYAGPRPAAEFVLPGLVALENRGYDSWGFVLQEDGPTYVVQRGLGPPSKSPVLASPPVLSYRLGLGHTRWATHGRVCLENAHPIEGGFKANPSCLVVHNGVIEGYEGHRKALEDRGYVFRTETDTEVAAHLFDWLSRQMERCEATDELAMQHMEELLSLLKGDLALAITSWRFPGWLLAACRGTPLLVTDAGHLASEASAFAGFATGCVRLADGAAVRHVDGDDGWYATSLGESITVPEAPPPPEGSSTHMLREIREQPDLLALTRPGLFLNRPPRAVLFGCGSSYHAAMLGAMYLEGQAKVPAEAHHASEFLHRDLTLYPAGTLFVALTQSGETKDTLEGMKKVQLHGAASKMVLVNEAFSAAARMGWGTVLLQAGKERGVAATKTFTAQAAALLDISFACGRPGWFGDFGHVRKGLSDSVAGVLAKEEVLANAARRLASGAYDRVLYLATGLLYPAALEGALKMKEVSYLHAEAMPAAEMKHGPIALVDGRTLAVFVLGYGSVSDGEKITANAAEVRSRGGDVLALADGSNWGRLPHAGHTFWWPGVCGAGQPIVASVAMQLLAYHAALARGLDVDRPRNLAKTVTV